MNMKKTLFLGLLVAIFSQTNAQQPTGQPTQIGGKYTRIPGWVRGDNGFLTMGQDTANKPTFAALIFFSGDNSWYMWDLQKFTKIGTGSGGGGTTIDTTRLSFLAKNETSTGNKTFSGQVIFNNGISFIDGTPSAIPNGSVWFSGGKLKVREAGVTKDMVSSFDSTSLSARIEARLKLTDTASMLTPYLRKQTFLDSLSKNTLNKTLALGNTSFLTAQIGGLLIRENDASNNGGLRFIPSESGFKLRSELIPAGPGSGNIFLEAEMVHVQAGIARFNSLIHEGEAMQVIATVNGDLQTAVLDSVRVTLPTIQTMKEYNRLARYIFVTDTIAGGAFYRYEGPIAANDSTVYTSAIGPTVKWRRELEGESFDTSPIGDLASTDSVVIQTSTGYGHYSVKNLIFSTGSYTDPAWLTLSWSKVGKTGSSLADLANRSAADLSSGTLDDARLSSNVVLIAGSQSITGVKTMTTPILNGARLGTTSTSTYVWTATDAIGNGSWQAPSGGGGSGTVSSGAANRLAYYASSGTTITNLAAMTANRLVLTDANGLPIHSTVTATEASYLSGVTSALQPQINGLVPKTLTANTTIDPGSFNLYLLNTSANGYFAVSSTEAIYGCTSNSFTTFGSAMKFTDNRVTKVGIVYAGDYSAGFTARSIVDKGYVDNAQPTATGTSVIKTSNNLGLVNDSSTFPKRAVYGNIGSTKGWYGTIGIDLTAVATGSMFVWRSSDSTMIPFVAINSQSGTTYTVLATDAGKVIHLSNTAARTITLPLASGVPAGYTITLKDAAGTASTANITVNRSGSDTIDGGTSSVMSSNYQGRAFYSNGTNWFIL